MDFEIPTVKSLISSASKYAQNALDAYESSEYELFSIFAATALEHITKACLTKRHPALLLNLQGKDSWKSLLFFVGATEKRPEKLVTVSLRDSLWRVGDFFESNARTDDLFQLIDIRDGAIHAAANLSIEERLVVAFLRQMEASRKDLNLDRQEFWTSYLGVVDAILSEEADRVKRNVELKLQQARVKFKRNLAPYSDEIKRTIMQAVRTLREDEASTECPACDCLGIAVGVREYYLMLKEESQTRVTTTAYASFEAKEFACGVCGLILASPEEIQLAGMNPTWEFEIDKKDFSYDFEVLDLDANN